MKNRTHFVALILSPIFFLTGFLSLNATVSAIDLNSGAVCLVNFKSFVVQGEKRFEPFVEAVENDLFTNSLKTEKCGVGPIARINPGFFHAIIEILEKAGEGDPFACVSLVIFILAGVFIVIAYIVGHVQTVANKETAESKSGVIRIVDIASSQNGKISLEDLLKAAATNDPDAMFLLGAAYSDICGKEKIAAEWFQKAAELGQKEATLQLAYCYSQGRGVEQNELQAGLWLMKAAELGHDGAMYMLGRWYEEGIFGFLKDVSQAKTWFRKAAELGNESAIKKLKEYENL